MSVCSIIIVPTICGLYGAMRAHINGSPVRVGTLKSVLTSNTLNTNTQLDHLTGVNHSTSIK